MSYAIKRRLVRIGNSRGIRIPKIWLRQLNLGEEVELAIKADGLIIRAARRPRQDWEERFRAMREHGDDALVDETLPTRWENEEWVW